MRVLIADDDPIIRLDLKQMLENLGYSVVAEAEDGEQAVEMALQEQPEVCLLDVKMPIKDGVDAATEIIAKGIAPAILLTAYSDEELINRASKAGVFGYLVKPFKPSDLPPAIQVARSRFEQSQKLKSERDGLEEQLETRKLVERAKGILMNRDGSSEEEAYRLLQKRSMDERKSMRELAEEVIASASE